MQIKYFDGALRSEMPRQSRHTSRSRYYLRVRTVHKDVENKLTIMPGGAVLLQLLTSTQ